MSDSEDRTTEPSAYRISIARGMGVLPLAPAIVRSVSLSLALLFIYLRAHALADGLVQMIQNNYQLLPEIISGDLNGIGLRNLLLDQMILIIEPLLVVLVGTWVIIFVVHQIVTGGSWTPTLAIPDLARLLRFWSKFDGDSGDSRPALVYRIATGILRPTAAVIGCLAVTTALNWSWDNSAIDYGNWSVDVVRKELITGRLTLIRSLALLITPLMLLGLFEWYIARRHWIERLMPSKDEARREIRELEGDPELKSRRKKLALTIRELGKIENLLPETEAVIVGTTMTGLTIQLIKLSDGRWAAGEVLRGTIAARYAEKCASKGKPWIRDSKLSIEISKYAETNRRHVKPLPDELAKQIQIRIVA